MKLLLDTQAWLWMVSAPERLSRRARRLVSSRQHELWLSSISAWEIVVKHGLGKLDLPSPPEEYVPSRMRETGVLPLAVNHAHALRVAGLPLHHRDPFDRLLIAQALCEGLSFLTADRQLGRYDVPIVHAGG